MKWQPEGPIKKRAEKYGLYVLGYLGSNLRGPSLQMSFKRKITSFVLRQYDMDGLCSVCFREWVLRLL